MRVVYALAAGVLFAALTGRASAEQPFSFDKTYGRLPKTVVPIEYDIAVRPDVDKHTFAGQETVSIRVRSATAKIVVNTLDLDVQSAMLSSQAPATIVTDNKKQETTFTFARTLPPGMYRLTIRYTGTIGTEPAGLFYQPYTTAGGAKEQMLATQFESTDARRFFPSWDEPAFRATYRLTATVPADFDAISNMPAEHTDVQGNRKVVQFRRTPSMSTYLLVFAAGRFSSIESKVDGITVRVYAPKDRIEQGRYALESATKLLAYYDDYFGYKFPLPKLDLIDIPGGFPGAMENWGGITFTERALLFDPRIESDDAKIEIFETIAHEMAHQWAGDLVTIGWWDDIWLAEGFADWMQTKATDHFNPSWHLWDRIGSDVERAMRGDAQVTAHAMQQPVLNETQAEGNFDEIVYEKAGALVRMTEEYLGETTFRNGARRYVREHAYSNTTSADLWTAIGSVAHRNMRAYADPWTAKAGFPLVSVTASCDGPRRTLALSQQRFFAEPGQHSTQLWEVPVAIRAGSTTSYTLLTGPNATVSAGTCGSPLVVNAGATGYYRVQYDPATLGRVSANMMSLDVIERARLLNDNEALALAGRQTPAITLDLINKIPANDAIAVWQAALDAVNGVGNMEVGQPGESAFDAFRVRTLRPVLARLGWEGAHEDASVTAFRGAVIESLGSAGDADVIAQARARFARFLADPTSLPASLRTPVLMVVGMHADAATWERLHGLIATSRNLAEARQYTSALWGAHDPALAAKNLNMAIDGEIPPEVGPEVAFYDIATVARAGRQPALAWAFFKAHESQMAAKLSAFEQGFLVADLAPVFWNGAPPSEIDAFFEKMPNVDPAQVKRAENAIADANASRQRIEPAIDAWVAAHAGT